MSNSEFDKAAEGLSQGVVYALKPTSKRMVLDRKTVKRDPNGKSDFKNGETAQFTLDGDEFLDPHTVYLRGKLKAWRADGVTALGAAVLPRLYGGAIKTVQQMKLTSRDGKEIEKIESMNVLSDILNNCCLSDDYLKANGQAELLDGSRIDSAAAFKHTALAAGEHYLVRSNNVLTAGTGTFITAVAEQVTFGNRVAAAVANLVGSGPAVAAAAAPGENAVAAVNRGACYADKLFPPKYETKEATDWIKDGKDFIIPLFKYLGFFKQGKYIPMKYLGAMKLDIQFVSDALLALKCAADPTDISFKISELSLVYDSVRINDILQSSIEKEIMSDPSGMPLDFRTYYHVTKDSTADSNITLTFDKGATDCLSAYTVIRPAAVAFDTEALEFKNYANVANTNAGRPAEWQYRIGSATFPVDKVITYPQARAELDKAMGHFGDGSRVNLSMSEFSQSKYVMAIDLENDPSSNYTGRSTNSGSQLNLQISGLETATAKTFDGFLYHTKVIRIKPNYNIDLYE